MADQTKAASAQGAFALLHRTIQEQLYKMGWTDLRPIQVDGIHAVLESDQHIIITAATAGGKTEAAFLPVLSRIVDDSGSGVRAMYVGPLKALINDQFRRLEDLCGLAAIPVTKWHGDVSASAKSALLKDPAGVLLITPESIESLFINHASKIGRLFARLSYVVIDEVHAFVGAERGAHLQSLLARLRPLSAVAPRLIGLSATVGDPRETARWLNPGDPNSVLIIDDPGLKRSVKYLIKGYLRDTTALTGDDEQSDEAASFKATAADDKLADDLLRTFYGKTALVFANAKARIEFLADRVRALESQRGMPDRIRVHHGSLSKAEREETEEDLRSEAPTVAFCSSTLELGIDVGNVKAVGQVGPPWMVSSLAQRLGRSGRRQGESAVMYLFVQEDLPGADADPVARLYPELLQSVAMTELLLKKWYEPPSAGTWHLSVLVQQILSVIAERGGASAGALFDALVRRGAFGDVDQGVFVEILRSLGKHDLVNQAPEGDIILGMLGEKIVRSADFYAVFMGSEEMNVIHAGKCIGTVAAAPGTAGDGFIILAGRRWKVIAVDKPRKEIIVEPSRGGRLPTFASSGGGDIHHVVRQEMRRVALDREVPVYLDADAKDMLASARNYAESVKLAQHPLQKCGECLYWFTWAGTVVNRTLTAIAKYADDVKCWDAGVAIGFEAEDPDAVRRIYRQFLDAPTSAEELAGTFAIKARGKYDGFLSEELQTTMFARNCLDIDGAMAVVRSSLL